MFENCLDQLLQFCNICDTSKQHYLVLAVEGVLKLHQDALFDVIRRQNEAVVVGGDARCCSPGYTAKYGSYSLMDLLLGQILDVQLAQVRN